MTVKVQTFMFFLVLYPRRELHEGQTTPCVVESPLLAPWLLLTLLCLQMIYDILLPCPLDPYGVVFSTVHLPRISTHP